MKPPRHGPSAGYPKDTDGWPLCRYCGGRCPTRRNTFCSHECVHEWKIRSSAAYARAAVGQRDGGICASCGADTAALMNGLTGLRRRINTGATSAERIQAARDYAAEAQRLRVLGFNCRIHWSGWPEAGQFWQADHIMPVEHGGGMAGLDNLQTLCTPCHKAKTRAQAAQRKRGAPNG